MRRRARRPIRRRSRPVRIGYKLSSEEQGPRQLVRLAGMHQVGPDQAGFMRFSQHEVLPRVRAVLTG